MCETGKSDSMYAFTAANLCQHLLPLTAAPFAFLMGGPSYEGPLIDPKPVWTGEVYLYHKMTLPSNLGCFWSFLRGGHKFGLPKRCYDMDLNEAVSPWRRKSWRKRYKNTMRIQNQANLAAGAHQGKAYEQAPALICDSYAPAHLVRNCHFGGLFCS